MTTSKFHHLREAVMLALKEPRDQGAVDRVWREITKLETEGFAIGAEAADATTLARLLLTKLENG